MLRIGYIRVIVVTVIIQYAHAQGTFVVNDGLGTVFSGREGYDGSDGISWRIITDKSATIEVKINCRNVPGRGLVCSADYPDHCKEQWRFPNPCTQNNIDMNVTKFVHPYDRSKFLMCGQMGKLYVVQCPQYEVFHEGCSQCVGAEAGLTASCEVPLPPSHRNVCTREAILNNKLFFPYPGNLSRFIHCDIWGKPWERICTPGEVWSKWDVTCVLPHLLNPCNRPTTDLNYLYSHPCDPTIYLTCDSQGRAHEVNCLRGEAFHEETQRCQPYANFTDQVLSSFCEHYMFGFRQNHGNAGVSINSQTGMSQNVGGAISGFQRDNQGITVDRTSRKIDGSISFMPDPSGQGSTTTFDLRGGQLNRETNLQGQGTGTASFDRTTQLKGGSLEGQVRTDGQGNFGGSIDIRRGSASGSNSGIIGQGSVGDGSGTNYIDIRDQILSTDPRTAEYVDIRNTGTSGSSANMLDIRGEKGIGSRNMVDIRPGSANSGLGVSGSQTDAFGRMIDIRGQGTGPRDMIDIRRIKSSSSGTGMLDIRGGDATGTRNMKDIRTGGISGEVSGSLGTDLTGGMVDIRYQESTGMVGMEGGRGVGTGTIGTGSGMADIRGGKASATKKMIDIRRFGTGGMTGGTGTDLSGGMNGIIDTGSIGNSGMSDIRVGKASATNNMVDIRRFGTGGMTGGMGTDLSGGTGASSSGGIGMSDIRVGKTSATNKMVDVRGDGTSSMTGISGTDLSGGIGTSGGIGGMSDIRVGKTSATKNMVDVRKFETGGMTGSTGTDLTGGILDIIDTGTGSSGSGMADIRVGKASATNNLVDIRRGGTNGMTGDVSSLGAELSGGMVEIGTTGTGSINNGMRDIRGGMGSGTKNMADIRTDGLVGSRVDMSSTGADLSGGSIDIIGTGTGTSNAGMADIRFGQASGKKTTLDMQGLGEGTGSVVGITGSGTQVTGGMVGGSLSGGGGGFVDSRSRQNMADIRRSQTGTSGANSMSSRGIGGVSSFDIRNQLGLNGQSNNIDRSGTVRTDSISIEGTIQGGRQGSGTMQDLLNTWNQIIETGSSSSTGTGQITNTQTGSNQGGNRRILNDLFTVHPSRLKMYDYSDIPFSEPCTQINLDEGRTHFRFRGHPHMFLQCDTSGRMHRMPCSTVGQDYFDPYTNTCVDGPVHVDNRIQ